ncbi:MAG TPA: hypothetical protein VFL99_11880 [Segeticoccus sp.]|uniref:hypothetical protein n=1 Tax=Segeticoccus sp. TaxID=2706531 RepID=UPI002D81132A|nr:hypothetical protein [Segeticoccus sp.]HET8601017.1 hypothetical protein [Segeticoccus sp.]
MVDLLYRSLQEAAAAAVGQSERHDPVRAGTGGPAGNALITAWVGLVLFALFLAELVTLLDVRGLISWHVAIGALLVPPALVKTASTGWRIVRYYRGNPDYERAGPPPLLLRLLGPMVVVSTLALLTTGVLLIVFGQDTSRRTLLAPLGFRIDWITLHQATFAAWTVATGLHVLARLVPALRRAGARAQREEVPGAALRMGIMVALLAAAAVIAVLLVQADASWHLGPPNFNG